jgi:hypothetical protein
MDAPEILTKAADVIDERGWHRGAYENHVDGGVCVMGAMCVAVGLPPNAIALAGDSRTLGDVHAAADRLERWLGIQVITEWNDESAEDIGEVTKALRECAAELSKETTR